MCGSNVVNSRINWGRNRALRGARIADDSFFRAIRALFALSFCLGLFVPHVGGAGVVFNELYVQPGNAADPHEFIELFNRSNQTIDLGDWEIRGGIRFKFSDGIELSPGSFQVVAENPLALEEAFGVASLGPFSGSLSNEGESLRLEDSNGEIVDLVDFELGFPWPTIAAGGGSSLELLHPDLDNNVGLAWRSSGFGGQPSLDEALRRLEEAPAESSAPTPGQTNSVFSLPWAPNVERVGHSPRRPSSGDVTVFEVQLGAELGVGSVTLWLQIVAPGRYQPAYLPQPIQDLRDHPGRPLEVNPAFASTDRWVPLPMLDDGEGGDLRSGDGVFTAQLGPFSNRTLVRYRVEIEGKETGQSVSLPLADDPGINFAFFVYDGVPAYPTTSRTLLEDGVGSAHSSEVMNSLPVYHLLTRNEDLWVSHGYTRFNRIPNTNIDARRAFNWEGALVYEGEVYDHVRYRLRQNNDRYNADWGGKRSFRFRFNRTRRFRPKNDLGERYAVPWRSLNLSKMIDGKRNQTFGLPEAMNSWLWNLVNIPAPKTHYVQMRVIDGEVESPAGDEGQYHGDFWGVFLAFEDYDSGFVKAHDLPDGNLYKLRSSILDGNRLKRHQGEHATTGDEDFQNIRMNLRPERDTEWLHRYVDYDRWYRYHTVNEAIRHFDYLPLDRFSKNRAWFFAPVQGASIGRLWVLPWDSDTSWGPNWGTGLDYPKQAIFEAPGKADFKREYRNVMREFTDLIWTPEVIGTRLDEIAELIGPIIRADRDRWIQAPYGPPLAYGSLADKVAEMKAFAFEGWRPSFPGEGPVVPEGGRAAHLRRLVSDEGEDLLVPARPEFAYRGAEAFPGDGLHFELTGVFDPQGLQSVRGFRWRLADMSYSDEDAQQGRPRPLEWRAVAVSEVRPLESRSFSLPTGLVKAGRQYRLRIQIVDETDRRSEWSESFEWTSAPFEKPVAEAVSIRVSEIYYHPVHDKLEFIEFVNVGGQGVWLDELSLHGGVSFRWGDAEPRAIEPGERFLIVQDQESFAQAFPRGSVQVIGEYDGQLSNGEEEFELRIAGQSIQSVAYRDDWFPETDGGGASLVANLDAGTNLNWTERESWAPSEAVNGTPGTVSRFGDLDGDGMRDAWELSEGLDPFDSSDGNRRIETVGVTAYQHWLASRCSGSNGMPSGEVEITLDLGNQQASLRYCPQQDAGLDDLKFVRMIQFQRSARLGTSWFPVSDWIEDLGLGLSSEINLDRDWDQAFFRAVERIRPRP